MDEKNSSSHGVRWDLTDLYSGMDDPKIDADLKGSVERAKAFEDKYREIIKPGLSAGQLFEAVQEFELIYQDGMKPLFFAHLNFSGDTRSPENGALVQKTREGYTDFKKHLK